MYQFTTGVVIGDHDGEWDESVALPTGAVNFVKSKPREIKRQQTAHAQHRRGERGKKIKEEERARRKALSEEYP